MAVRAIYCIRNASFLRGGGVFLQTARESNGSIVALLVAFRNFLDLLIFLFHFLLHIEICLSFHFDPLLLHIPDDALMHVLAPNQCQETFTWDLNIVPSFPPFAGSVRL